MNIKKELQRHGYMVLPDGGIGKRRDGTGPTYYDWHGALTDFLADESMTGARIADIDEKTGGFHIDSIISSGMYYACGGYELHPQPDTGFTAKLVDGKVIRTPLDRTMPASASSQPNTGFGETVDICVADLWHMLFIYTEEP